MTFLVNPAAHHPHLDIGVLWILIPLMEESGMVQTWTFLRLIGGRIRIRLVVVAVVHDDLLTYPKNLWTLILGLEAAARERTI